MTGSPDELVEKAARAFFRKAVDPSGPMVDVGIRAALEAVGLPALLERVEAALAIHERRTPDAWTGSASSSPPFDRDYCPRCRVNWPCETAAALTEGTEGA